MGHLTILVQHAWKIQNYSKDGNPVSYEIDKIARGVVRPISAPMKPNLAEKPLASHVRVTIPSSIAQLVSYYNTCQTKREQKDCEDACVDMLYRLEQILNQSKVLDTQKNVRFVLPKQQGYSLSKRDRRSKKIIEKNLFTNGNKSTKYAAEARISVLMLARCNNKYIRNLALLLLAEALDTNQLSASDHEIMHLQMLWVELVQMLRNVIDVRQQKAQEVCESVNETEKKGERDISEEHGSETKITVDSHFESLLICMTLTLQRIDYVKDTGKKIQPSSLMEQSYECILEDLKSLQWTDPYHSLLISTITENAIDFKNANQRNRDVSVDMAVTVLSQVVAMEQAHFMHMDQRFYSIMHELCQRKEWSLGKKVIQLLSVMAALHMEGCAMFIKLTNQLCLMNSEWHYVAVLGLGMVAAGSQYPNIRRLALEQGIIPSTEYGEGIEKNIENSWMVRASAVTSLAEIYQQYKKEPQGLLARQVLQSRKKKETNEIVKQLLHESKCNIPMAQYLQRISFLNKYMGISLAEIHSDIQSDYQYMKKYIQSTEEAEKRKQEARRKSKLKKLQKLEQDTIKELESKGIHVEMEVPTQNPKKLIVGETPQLAQLSTRKGKEYSNLENIVLSNEPYHQEKVPADEVDHLYTTMVQGTKPVQKLPKIGPSFIAPKGIKQDPTGQQDIGTANRRKMFHPEKEFLLVPAKPKNVSIKIPTISAL